jgi:hypothetical protein
MFQRLVWLGLLGLLVSPLRAEPPVLAVPVVGGTLHVEVPWPADAPGEGVSWQLWEGETAFPAERLPAIRPDGQPDPQRFRLLATIPPRAGASGTRRLTLRPEAADTTGSRFRFEPEGTRSLRLSEGDRPVFVYNFDTIPAPPGVPADRARAAYVHPIWGLDGEILTDDFPKDHYHHRGLFWSWPHVTVGDEPRRDLWALSGIRHGFVDWLARHEGTVAAVLGVQNAWLVEDRPVLDERVWLTVYPARGDEQVVDLRCTFIPKAKPITLAGAEGKSYGGVTLRFGPRPAKETTILSDRGDTPDDLPMTRLSWADLSAKFDGRAVPSGIALLVAPEHPDFPPEWLTRHYGALCVGWPGVTPKTLPAGEPVTLRYRLIIHRGPGDRVRLAGAQGRFAAEATATWETDRD